MNRKSILAALLAAAMMLPSFIMNITAQAADIGGWTVGYMGDIDATVTGDSEVCYSGNGAMKIVNKTPAKGNVYVQITQDVQVEKGKKYYVGAMIKAQKATTATFMVDWGVRHTPTDYGKTFNWTNAVYLYEAQATGTVTWRMVVEGVCDGVWIDDCVFEDIETGENLLINPKFDTSSSSGSAGANAPTLDSELAALNAAESFTEDELKQLYGKLKFIPAYKKDDITVDADASDWEDVTPIRMPVSSDQYQIYIAGSELDNSATFKLAYDNQFIYVLAEVTDNRYVYKPGSGNYWQGDSLQFAIGSMDSSYGTEVGIALNPNKEECDLYGITRTAETNIFTKGRHSGNYTIYELAFPWDAFFSFIPDRIYFDIDLNDNDGEDRNYGMELAPGIAENKTNAKFPILCMMPEDSTWYGWVEGPRTGEVNTEYEFEYYVVNTTDDNKTFNITEGGNISQEEVPAHTGIKRKFTRSFEADGKSTVSVTAESEGKTETLAQNIVIAKPVPDEAYTRGVMEKIASNAAEIKKLIDKCSELGIPTDYEMISYRILERFPEYLEMDIGQHELTRVYYTEETTDDIYKRTKAKLEAYIKGIDSPLEVPRYVTGEKTIDGTTILADAKWSDGSMEKDRPTFFVGYMSGGYLDRDMQSLDQWGANTVEVEIGLNTAMSVVKGWALQENGSPKGVAETTTSKAHSGGKSMHLIFTSPTKPDQYLHMPQTVTVEPNHTYTFKGYAYSDNGSSVAIAVNDWWDRIEVTGTPGEWSEFSTKFTTSSLQAEDTIRIMWETQGTDIYLDDLQFIDDKTGENLLVNGGFEESSDDGLPAFDETTAGVKRLLKRLDTCTDADLAVNVLLGPHYFFNDIMDKYDIRHTGTGFMPYNVNAPIAKEIVERYMRGLIPLIKDYECIQSVEILNEPEIWFDKCGSFYRDGWHEFLKERYGTIEALNTSWKADFADFDDIPMDRDTAKPAAHNDYILFNDKIFSEWKIWVSDIIHEIWPEAKIGEKVMGYLGNQYTYRIAMGNTRDRYVDVFDMNSCDYWNYYTNELSPVTEAMWYDYMRSVKNMPIANTEDHVIPDGSANYDLDHAKYVGQNVYMGAIHGRAMSDIWIWGWGYNTSGVDNGSILRRPDAIEQTGRAALDLNRNAYEITALENETADAAILYSDASMYGDMKAMHAAFSAYEALLYNGKAVRFVIDSQKEKMHNYKLLIVPLARYVKPEVLNEVKTYIENGGKVLVIGEESFERSDRDLPADEAVRDYVMSNATVIPYNGRNDANISPTQPEMQRIIKDILRELDLEYAEVIDAETGEAAQDLEYSLGVYDGRVIINLSNYGEERKVRVILGGKPIEYAEELRSGKDTGDVIELGRYEVKTLSADYDDPFFDTYYHWGRDEITELYKKGIVNGVSFSRFEPEAIVTEAEFLALVIRSCGIDAEGYNAARGISQDKWYAKTAAAGFANGVIDLTDFEPERAITRQKMTQMLSRAYSNVLGRTALSSEASFADNDSITDLAAVSAMASLGVVKGYDDNTFRPDGTATRAEAAAMVNRFDNLD